MGLLKFKNTGDKMQIHRIEPSTNDWKNNLEISLGTTANTKSSFTKLNAYHSQLHTKELRLGKVAASTLFVCLETFYKQWGRYDL